MLPEILKKLWDGSLLPLILKTPKVQFKIFNLKLC